MKTIDHQNASSESDTLTQSVSPRSWMILALLCVAQFVNVLNFQSVTLVLPAIQHALRFSTENLQWVVSANVLAFGGGLLFAGRLADHFGHRRIFFSGLLLCMLSTLICGLSTSQLMLILARIVQGVSSALMIPAALALLIDIFSLGVYRHRALSIWGAVGPLGGMAGTLAGSSLADHFGWPWIFFLNVPVVLVALLLGFKLLPSSHTIASTRSLDLMGALLSTCSIVLLIAGLTQIVHPLGNAMTLLALFGGGLIFLLLFCFLETRISYPLLPLRFLLRPDIAGASLVTLAFSATANTPIFFFTLYMQQVRGFSSFITGLAFLPTNVLIIIGSFGATKLISRLGYKYSALVGLVLLVLGSFLYACMSVNGDYIWTLLPALVLVGAGLGVTQVVVTGAGTERISPTERGLASSLLNMASQIGTALGLAVLVSVANVRTSMLTMSTRPAATDLIAGFQWAFYGGAVFGLLGICLTLFTFKKSHQ